MDILAELYALTIHTIVVLAMPFIVVVATVGVVASLVQALFGISDQNLAFAPKIAAAAACCLLGGAYAMRLLEQLLIIALQSLPRLAM